MTGITIERVRGNSDARMLMKELDQCAQDEGFTLLLLDTCRDSAAEKLYASLGWNRVGMVPNFALNPDGEDRFDMAPLELATLVSQPREKSCVDQGDSAVVPKRQESAWGVVDEIGGDVRHRQAVQVAETVARYSLIRAIVSSGWLMCGQ